LRTRPLGRLATPIDDGDDSPVADGGLTPEDVRAIILAIMRIEEKLDALFPEEDDEDGEEEDLA
jgi:hypothetical protein